MHETLLINKQSFLKVALVEIGMVTFTVQKRLIILHRWKSWNLKVQTYMWWWGGDQDWLRLFQKTQVEKKRKKMVSEVPHITCILCCIWWTGSLFGWLYLLVFLCRLILVRKKESAKGRNKGSRMGVKQRNRAKLLLLLLKGSKEMASVWKHEGVKQLTVTALLKGYLQLQVLSSMSYVSLKKNRKLIQFSNGCFQARREKISVRMKLLQSLVPGCDQVLINYLSHWFLFMTFSQRKSEFTSWS